MNHFDMQLSPPSRRESGKRIARTHAALLDALLLLLEEKAFEQITVKEITGRAKVGYATFFRRYPDKEALLHDLAAQEIQNLLTMTLPIFHTADTTASTQALCAYVWKHRKLWRALLTGGAAATLKEEYLRLALQVAEQQIDSDAWLPVDLAVRFSVTALVETLSWWLIHDAPPNVEAMAGIVNRLAVQPVFSPAD
ncbi:MAG: TetR/AcrR family transcriptional regulator [Halioglobus sp.]|nr:TetR/AcrR family transcriptional regulator [Halioglobus sp.]